MTFGRGALAALMLCVALPGALPGSLSGARAAESVLVFENAADEARYTALLGEYRCLKCQNQSLADSGASLAQDLRTQIYERVLAGEPKSAIDEYLVARYGEFVLYRPRLTMATALLWIGPFVLLGIALAAAVAIGRRSGRGVPAPDAGALAEARRLLDDPAAKDR